MILPEDTKAPLSDDEYDELDSADFGIDEDVGVPFVPHPSIGYGHPLTASNLAGNNQLEAQPFLGAGGDVELAIYPPPYTPRAGSSTSLPPPKSARRNLRDRLRDAPRLAIGFAVLFFLYIVAHPGRRHWRHPPPGMGSFPGGGGAGGFGGDQGNGGRPRPGHPGDDDYSQFGGQAVECAVFTDSQVGANRAAEAVFALPLAADQLFFSLRGPADVGIIEVDAYDYVDSSSVPDSAITFGDEAVADARRGPPVIVTVRGEFSAPETGAADTGNSPGWAMLSASKVCLMLQNGSMPLHSPHQPPPAAARHGHGEGPDGGHRNGPRFGVAVRSKEVADVPSSSLTFRIHVSLPRSKDGKVDTEEVAKSLNADARRSRRHSQTQKPGREAGFIDTLLGAFGSHAPSSLPVDLVPPITIRSEEGNVHVGDLSGVNMAGFEVRAVVGDVVVEHVRAEVVNIKTLGNIRANVSVSHSVELVTPAGAIDLDLSLAKSPAHRFFLWESEQSPDRPHTQRPSNNRHNSSDPECALQPITANVNGNNDRTIVRHGTWEVPCRQLSQRVHSMVGDIEIYAHPNFEGDVRFSTSKGEIEVDVTDETADPTGAGRRRVLDLNRAEHNGAKKYRGTIEWADVQGRERDVERHTDDYEYDADEHLDRVDYDDEFAEGDRRESNKRPHPAFPGDDHGNTDPEGRRPPPPPWMNQGPGLTIETSVGDVKVVF